MAFVSILALELLLLVMLADEWLVLGGYYLRKRARLDIRVPTNLCVVFLVAAHNEESVISGLLVSINQLNWPRDQISVWLVADRCTDRTAEFATQSGANVWVRSAEHDNGDVRPVGKGHALTELLQCQAAVRERADLFVILDADVRLTPDYLRHMLCAWSMGYPVVQGASLTASSQAASLAQVNSLANRVQHVVQQGRLALGLPNLIIGNTLLIDRRILESLDWQLASFSPTEEEIKVALVDREVPIGYAAEAVVFEESVTNVADLARQRSRWFRDYVLFLVRAGVPLLWTSLLTGRWRRAEAALAHFWLTSHTLELMAFTATIALAGLTGSSSLFIGASLLWFGKTLHMLGLCLAAGVGPIHLLRIAILYPRLAIGWVGGMWLWLRRPTANSWNHTKHHGH